MNRSRLPWHVIKKRTMPPPGGKARFRREESETHEMAWRATAELLLGSRLGRAAVQGHPTAGPNEGPQGAIRVTARPWHATPFRESPILPAGIWPYRPAAAWLASEAPQVARGRPTTHALRWWTSVRLRRMWRPAEIRQQDRHGRGGVQQHAARPAGRSQDMDGRGQVRLHSHLGAGGRACEGIRGGAQTLSATFTRCVTRTAWLGLLFVSETH